MLTSSSISTEVKIGPDVLIETTVPTPAASNSLRLTYLDGIRGVAAFYVLLHHMYQQLLYGPAHSGISPLFFKAMQGLSFGHYAVDVFIVISGYCLMLPVIRSGTGRLRGGLGQYLKRRSLRILLPYFAALVLALVVISLTAAVESSPTEAARVGGQRTLGAILSHLAVVHNLFPQWATAIDPPMWSVGTEWQLYFVFPFFLLPLWRRLGCLWTALIGLGSGLLLDQLLHGSLKQAAPWYIGLFAFGMAGAVLNFSTRSETRSWQHRTPWGVLAATLGIGFVLLGIAKRGWYASYLWEADIFAGLFSFCLLVFCTKDLRSEVRSRTVQALTHPQVVALGAFSYSIYLVHYPLISLIETGLRRLPGSANVHALALFALGIPLILAIAYGFHCVFERPFMVPEARPASTATK